MSGISVLMGHPNVDPCLSRWLRAECGVSIHWSGRQTGVGLGKRGGGRPPSTSASLSGPQYRICGSQLCRKNGPNLVKIFDLCHQNRGSITKY